MIRRTSSANQLSSEAALIASHTAAIPTSMPARIQNSDRAAFITVVSQPFAAVTTEFSSVVRTEPCWASAGVVTNSATLLPVSGAFVSAYTVLNGSARLVSSGTTDALGAYTIPALPPGTYSLSTYNFSDLIDEAYPDVPCPVRCEPLVAATLSVPVAQYATTSNRNFSLDPAGSVMGIVSDAATSTPLPSAFVT